jgi:hypothetical protein
MIPTVTSAGQAGPERWRRVANFRIHWPARQAFLDYLIAVQCLS